MGIKLPFRRKPIRYGRGSGVNYVEVLAPAQQTIGSGITINLSGISGGLYRVLASVDGGTIAFSGLSTGQSWSVQHTQSVGGGLRTVFTGVTWLGGAGAVSPAANAVDTFNFYSPDGVAVYGFQATTPFYSPPFYGSASTIVETFTRQNASSRGLPAAGTVMATHFTPDHDLTVSNLETACSGTLAVGSTLAKMGLATVGGTAASTTYTTIARTASDTTLWTAVAYYSRAIVDNGSTGISSVVLRGGVTYAFLILTVGNTTLPQLMGQGAGAGAGALVGTDAGSKLPRLCGTVTGQTDIPTSMTGVTGGTGSTFWGACY